LPNGGGDGKAFECLTVTNMKEFNQHTPDVDGVKYFSWGAVYEPGYIDTWKYVNSSLSISSIILNLGSAQMASFHNP